VKTVNIQAELRAHIARKYVKQVKAAEAWGVSQAYVSSVLKGRKNPNDTMLEDAGFERVVQYKKMKGK
jgi:predicted XRE-type DNA-binding protein